MLVGSLTLLSSAPASHFADQTTKGSALPASLHCTSDLMHSIPCATWYLSLPHSVETSTDGRASFLLQHVHTEPELYLQHGRDGTIRQSVNKLRSCLSSNCASCPWVQVVGPLHQRAQQLQADIQAIMTARYIGCLLVSSTPPLNYSVAHALQHAAHAVVVQQSVVMSCLHCCYKYCCRRCC